MGGCFMFQCIRRLRGAVRLGCLERLKCRKSSRQLKLEPVRPSSNRPGWVAVSLIGKLQAGTNSRHHLHGSNGSSLPTPSTSHEALHRGRGPWGSRYRRTTSRLLERSSSRRVLWWLVQAMLWAATVVVIAPTSVAIAKAPISKCMDMASP